MKYAAEKFVRQERIFTLKGMKKIQNTHIALVGAGGVSSSFILMAAQAGIKSITLVDPQKIEASNLNRIMGAGEQDIGTAKILYLKRRLIEILGVSADIRTFQFRVERDGFEGIDAHDVDVVVSGVDNVKTRFFLNTFCVRKKVPLLDLGAGCFVRNNVVRLLAGRACLYVPGMACLECLLLGDDDSKVSKQSYIMPNVTAAANGLKMLTFWLARRQMPANVVYTDCLNYQTTALFVKRHKHCPCCGKAGRLQINTVGRKNP